MLEICSLNEFFGNGLNMNIAHNTCLWNKTIQATHKISLQWTNNASDLHSPLTHWGRDKMDAISQTPFFKCIFLNENVWILIKISLKFVPKGRINNIPSLVQIMVWCRPGAKPLSEPMMVSLLTHICVTRPHWVKLIVPKRSYQGCELCYVFSL